eukprot:gene11634-4875_t
MNNFSNGLLINSNPIDEFSFISWYHSHKINQLLHQISIILIWFWIICLTCRYEISSGYNLSHFVLVFYSILFISFDFVVGFAHVVLFCIYYQPALYFMKNIWISATWWQIIFIILLLLSLQLFGHLIFQRSFPAFRLFEATVTTPFFMMFLLINSITGYKQQFITEVMKNKSKWNPKK